MKVNNPAKIKAIITGATGMVGEGILHECLNDDRISEVLVIGRTTCGVTHLKLKEIIHTNFYDISPIAGRLGGYNACFFCLGSTSLGKKETEYFALTYTLTMHVARTLGRLNPDMTFCYISGLGTDSTEKGKIMWARVKGKTENDLLKLPFKRVFNFRPGFMRPTKGLKHTHGYYKILGPLYPVFRVLFPKTVLTLAELGKAMINASINGFDKSIVDVKDIVALAKKV